MKEYISLEYLIKIIFISIFTYFLNNKLIHTCNKSTIIQKINILIKIGIIDLISAIIHYNSNSIISIIVLVLCIAFIFSDKVNKNIGYALMITTISISINYILYGIAIILSFIIFKFLKINNEYIILLEILTIYSVLLYCLNRIKKLKKGFSFLKINEKNEYFGIIILNISVILVFLFLILSNINTSISTMKSFFICAIIFSILMFITIQKSLQLYYKQKILIQDLHETKAELESKKKEIEELEKENLEYSKTSHSIAHKQKLLEYKLKQLLLKNEFAEDMDIKDEINNLTKEIRTKTLEIELAKTNINKIDDILKYMQSECIKEKIDFQLQLNGNIHYMINNCISEEELQILLADHIKNAIIAIKHTDNINKSILVRLGLIEGIYSVYIYDSGIEFNKETLVKLGKEPASTHLDEGGTGMGFMNTFDTLKKHKASMFIDEFNKPSKDNFTKVIKIIFDGKGEYKVVTYRYEEIKKVDINNEIKIIDKMDT